jgi:hypothetical protein
MLADAATLTRAAPNLRSGAPLGFRLKAGQVYRACPCPDLPPTDRTLSSRMHHISPRSVSTRALLFSPTVFFRQPLFQTRSLLRQWRRSPLHVRLLNRTPRVRALFSEQRLACS